MLAAASECGTPSPARAPPVQGFEFYDWPAPPGATLPVARLVTRYDQQHEDVAALLAALNRA